MLLSLLNFKKYDFSKLKKNLILTLFLLNQGCSSGVEVAANLSKKYLIPEDKKSLSPKPIYKIGQKYKIRNKFYFPKKNLYYNKTGIASWYGPKFHGKLTANGEIYNQYALTAAHKTLPLPSAVRVTNLQNNKSVILRINDRGPFVNERIIDLSSKAADILGLKTKGTGLVRVKILKDKSIMLEKLAKAGNFPEIKDLPKMAVPNVKVPKMSSVKIRGYKIKRDNNLIDYDSKFLENKYRVYIQIASFQSSISAEKMKNKLSYVEKIKIYKINKNGKFVYQVKAGPFLDIKKVDKLHSLLSKKGMQGARIIIE